MVDFDDFFIFADAFGKSDGEIDLNGDGMVDFDDFFMFADAFGNEVPGPARRYDSLEFDEDTTGRFRLDDIIDSPEGEMEARMNVTS